MSKAETALLIDFGSTYTKLRAVDLAAACVIGSGQGPSTVDTDINEGLTAALADLEARLGTLPDFNHRLASSSAAGGLRMVTVGLVRELTAEAACRAALGAGAKLVGTFAYQLTSADVAQIVALAPDILMLTGGTDGGNVDVIRENADRLALAELCCPVVVAGNRAVADEVATVLDEVGLAVTVTDNVMPEFNTLNIEPARAAIRRLFIDRIVHAKGIDRARKMFDAVLMPTPAAVLEGARLLADGITETPGLGPLLVVDVGGATTDVHSIADGSPTGDSVIEHGLPEPYAKRTVEGDLGMRHGIAGIVAFVGEDTLAVAAGLDRARFDAALKALSTNIDHLPEGDDQRAVDCSLASAAVAIAVARHAGQLSVVQTVTGPVTMQEGKDLGGVKTVIGTGGALAHGSDPAAIISSALTDAAKPLSLRPTSASLMLDADYLLYAVGLLAAVEPEAALKLGLDNLNPLDTKEAKDGCSSAA